jgi:hypothetical protein
MLAVLTVATCLALSTLGCASAPKAATVSQLLAAPEQYRSQRVKVAGVVAQEPMWTSSGGTFYISDSRDGQKLLRVDYQGSRPPDPSAPSTSSSPATWVGVQLLFWGDFDGTVLHAEEVLVSQGGPYRSPASHTVAP